MPKAQVNDVMTRISRKREIKTRIEEVIEEISRLPSIGMIAGPLSDDRARLNSLIYIHGRGEEGNVPEARKAELAELKNRVEKGCRDLDVYKEKETNLRAELAALKLELTTISCCVDRKELAELQSEIDKVEGEIMSLDKAITSQQAIIEQDQPAYLDDLYRQKEEILADSAMGKNVSKELDAIAKEIKDKEADSETAKKKRVEAEQAVNALLRRRDAVRERLAELKTDMKDVTIFYLNATAEAVSHDYEVAAGDIADIYGRLRALDVLLSERGGGSLLGQDAAFFRIPSIGPGRILSPPVFDARREDPASWVSDEKKRLEGAGLKI